MKPTFYRKVISRTETYDFRLWVAVLFILSHPALYITLTAQEETAPGKYRIEFTDKDNNVFSLENPEEFLSVRAIQRRRQQHIPVDFKDIPVSPAYLEGIRSTGARIHGVSKWFNAVTIDNVDSSMLAKVMELPFVRQVPLKKISVDPIIHVKPAISSLPGVPGINYGLSFYQIAIHNGDQLHASGFTGEGMHIAVLDAGFNDADAFIAFDALWQENRILGYRDFVSDSSSFFVGHTHGTTVLSVIGGRLPGYFTGSAPDASFWLFRTEDGSTEYIVEEDNWIAGAECADSAGADIINTSLGYTTFNDPAQNHTYDDMDGNSTRISMASDIAASRGMLVVVSAGNEGNSPWRYISAPADADSVLAVGAVDSTGAIGAFSGRGPSSDDQIKPDVCAMGVRIYGVYNGETVARGNGTSFAAPVITGLAACLWQANPEASVMDIQAAIKESADRYDKPDTIYGYGIPDFSLANILLKRRINPQVPGNRVDIFPNPFSAEIYVWLNTEDVNELTVTLYDLSGKIVYTTRRKIAGDKDYLRVSGGLNLIPRGIYLMQVISDKWQHTSRLVKF